MIAELPLTFSAQLRKVQAANEDFEWYPTTDAIITALKRDIRHEAEERRYGRMPSGFLDIGAGNGKVISAVSAIDKDDECRIGKTYAIEKSHTLIDLLPKEVFILGCDFWRTSLIDKEIGFIFSNPPYSRYEEWSAKILREASTSSIIYLVIPERWEKTGTLATEMKARHASHTIIGSFDFEDAEDRHARAKVHLLKITFNDSPRRSRGDAFPVDPFTKFFNETFVFAECEDAEAPFEEQIAETQLVNRLNFIEALCHLYDLRMAQLQDYYQAICDIPMDILKEFDITKSGLVESLRMKLSTAKKEYWSRLFDGMAEIKTRLTHKSRSTIESLMHSQTGIDFNRDNAYAVVLWVIKNANGYFDEQLIETYEQMVEVANIENYTSNQRIFQKDRFRYNSVRDQETTHFRLKVGHRMVLNHVGGLQTGYSACSSGIDKRAANFLCDLITVANNLGFTPIDRGPREYEIKDSSARVYLFKNSQGAAETLFRVRVFQNRNMHIQFHPDFIHALNVQHGKLKGWLRNDAQAAAELDIPVAVAAKHFAPGFRLTSASLALMAPAA